MYCQLDYLGDCPPGRIQHALRELPETLDGTYERTLREIEGANWEFARRLFLCVAVATRPLLVEELAELLAFDFNVGQIPRFREDWRPEDPLEAVLSTCTTLLSPVNIYGSLVIQFSHFSVKEFLMSTRFGEKCDTISSRYHFSTTAAHTLVAQACLGILLHLDKDITKDSLKKFPLAEYAAEHWVEHVRVEGVSENVEEGMKQLFDGSKPHLAVWLWIYHPETPCMPYAWAEKPSRPLGTPLHYAAICGLPSITNVLAIEHPHDVASCGFEDELTPLHVASQSGYVEVARLLVEHGADMAARDKYGSTPLHLAVQEGREDLACWLVENGADLTAQDSDGRTPLHVVLREGRVDLARFFVEHGKDLTAQDNYGSTPLHEAVRMGSIDLARLLVEHGADARAKGKDGSTPLQLAVRYGSINLACLLVEHGADATTEDNYWTSLLHWAVRKGRMDFASLLVERGVDVTVQDKDGSTPLYFAVAQGRVDLARFLVEHGADVTAKDKDGSALLDLAMESGSMDLVRLLVEHRADLTAKNIYGAQTPLHWAVDHGRMDFVRLFVEHGADLTAQNYNGSTPLHFATAVGHVEFARLLLDRGADVTAQDEDGQTPLDIASKYEPVEMAHVLLEYGATAENNQ